MPPRIVHQDRVQPFATAAAFEEWLAAHHASEKEVWIRIYKKGSGVPTITPVQAIDVALCWGWTDGVRKGLDETSFLQRFTPRRTKDAWSQLNRDSVARLTAAGRMKPPGQRQVDRAKADGRLTDAPPRNATEAITPADPRVALGAAPPARENLEAPGQPKVLEPASRTNGTKAAAGRAKKNAGLVAPLAPEETIMPEPAVPERTSPKRPASAKARRQRQSPRRRSQRRRSGPPRQRRWQRQRQSPRRRSQRRRSGHRLHQQRALRKRRRPRSGR